VGIAGREERGREGKGRALFLGTSVKGRAAGLITIRCARWTAGNTGPVLKIKNDDGHGNFSKGKTTAYREREIDSQADWIIVSLGIGEAVSLEE